MQTIPFLTWLNSAQAKGPVAVVACNFGLDINWRIRVRGAYLDRTTWPQVCVVDNTGSVNSLSITFNNAATFIPANVRTVMPMPQGVDLMDVTSAAGAASLQFFANRDDAPPDQSNYAALFAQAIIAAIPTGAIWPFGGSVAPSGWLICDGSAVGRAVQNALFAVIGTQYGIGDGVTTFNIPDGRDRTFIGASPGGLGADRPSARVIGATGGAETHTLTQAEMPVHSHPGSLATATGVANMTGTNVGGADFVQSLNFGVVGTNNTGGGGAHNNMQPFFGGNWIIKT